MKKIDHATAQRILDAADIVEVVSDFVSLKKRGANYVGLCPFHADRNPSFYVSRAKGICKCFSCGKSASAVGFVMEHEQFSYYEALKYLAKKYNIEVKEREMTDTERQEASERESLMAVNDFALDFFEKTLSDTADGRDIGLAYFRERGISDLMIKKFRLGYSPERSDSLYKAATAKGFSEKSLIDTGLCMQGDHGIYDRFRGRVMYPIFTVSGRVVAFGGRILRKEKSPAKYMNSPESLIYRKSYELYGLYQAKQAIGRLDKCILVEGYMDVISMHQVGVENVVASSGTSLTQGQIRLISRFTKNVTVIYDSDAAGIKASLRGIDLLLAEGMNIKVLLLPDGEDPDSYAQSHSSTEVERYIADNETDFIRFKTRILLKDAGDDPIARANVIKSIVESIAVIPDLIPRTVYTRECARMLEIDESVLALQISKIINDNAGKQTGKSVQPATPTDEHVAVPDRSKAKAASQHTPDDKIFVHEHTLIKYILKYGLLNIAETVEDGGEETAGMGDVTVLDFINTELEYDGVGFTVPVFADIYSQSLAKANTDWAADLEKKKQELLQIRDSEIKAGQENIRQRGADLSEIELLEQQLQQKADDDYRRRIEDFAMQYLYTDFISSPDDSIRNVATDIVSERHHLSKIHTKYAKIPTEKDRLTELVPRAIMELKDAILDKQISEAKAQLGNAIGDAETELMSRLNEYMQLKKEFAKILGERTLNPQ